VRWLLSHRADPKALPLADRHYSRQKPGTKQYVPPGRCLVLLADHEQALWVTSWPFAQYVKHAWAGAWVNTFFRKECGGDASPYIRSAIAITRSLWEPPELGCITFVNPKFVRPVHRRGTTIYGYSYLKAGFEHVGFPKAGMWAWQLLPGSMPDPEPIPLEMAA
jgi:hypothetical protein